MGDSSADTGGADGVGGRRSLDDLSKEELLRFIRKLRDSHSALKTEFSECEAVKNTVHTHVIKKFPFYNCNYSRRHTYTHTHIHTNTRHSKSEVT